MGSQVKGTLLAIIAGLLVAGAAQAQTANESRDKINKKIAEARTLFTQKKYDEAAAAIGEADKLLVEFSAAPASKQAAGMLDTSIVGVRKLLEGKEVKLPERPAKPAPGAANTKAPAAAVAGTGFTKSVAPILVGKCNRCHLGNNRRGEFSMNSYKALMDGAKGVKVVEAGNGKASRLHEVLESGDMPRGGAKLSGAELATIEKWINEGAKFDGTNPTAPLTATTPVPAAAPPVAFAKATGNEKISYARDIAPLLAAANCVGCHGGRNPAANLALTSLNGLLKGGDTGPILIPGKGSESYVVKKLLGTGGGMRMPARRPPLSTDDTAKFETWINEGAKFDGMDPAQDTEMVANIYLAQHMSHDELAAKRLGMALKNWEIGNPEDKPEKVETPNFAVIGNVIKSRLEEIAEVAEKQHKEVAAFFAVPEGQPLLKGKLTLIVFARRFEFSEYGTMVENRKFPNDARGHVFYNIIDAYACMPPPEEGDTLESLVSEVLASAYVDSVGQVPTWFAVGSGRAIAAKLDPKSPAVRKWDERLPSILQAAGSAEGVLKEGGFSETDAPVVSYGFVKGLLGKKSAYTAVLAAVKKGATFEQALQSSYNGDATSLVNGWSRSGGAAPKKTKKGK